MARQRILLPSPGALACALMRIQGETDWPSLVDTDEAGVDPCVYVRLNVSNAGSWAVIIGLECYDTDHSGWLGFGHIYRSDDLREINELAQDLLDQAEFDWAEGHK